MRLAIISSHPIQYNAPWFALLADSPEMTLKVFYTWGQLEKEDKYDPGFSKYISWDVPLLKGYDFAFSTNISKEPGTHHFKGIINPTLIKEIEEFRPGALLVFGWAFASHLKVLRHFKGRLPILFRGDSTLSDETKGIRRILRRTFLTWVYSHIDYPLYVGTNNKDYFLAHGVKERKLVYAPHAVDNKRFMQDESNGAMNIRACREKLGINEHDFVILFSGKFEPKKNPSYIIQLAAKISSPHVKFLMVGDGTLKNNISRAASADKRIIILDFQNQLQMPLIYGLADIFILPSSGPGETWGLAVNEAMACRKPVLVSNKAGCAIDLVIQNRNGMIIDISDTDATVACINQLVEDPLKVQQMGNASLDIIQHFSFEKIVAAIRGVLIK